MMIAEYYKPGEIKYNKSQVEWLLRNVLFQDDWPSDHKETGYTGGKGKSIGSHANFETVRMIIGELTARLQLCGQAGLYFEYLTLIDYGDRDYMAERLAGYFHTTRREVHYLSNMAMRFCCGRKRKSSSFKRFCTYTNARRKKGGERTMPSPHVPSAV